MPRVAIDSGFFNYLIKIRGLFRTLSDWNSLIVKFDDLKFYMS